MNEALLETSQGVVPDRLLSADHGDDINGLLKYANLAQAMAHDCAVALRILQHAIDDDTGGSRPLLSGYGQGAIHRLASNAMLLIAAEGERVLENFSALKEA